MRLLLARALVLICLALMVLGIPFVLLGFDRLVTHPLGIIGLLLTVRILLFVTNGLCAAHKVPFTV